MSRLLSLRSFRRCGLVLMLMAVLMHGEQAAAQYEYEFPTDDGVMTFFTTVNVEVGEVDATASDPEDETGLFYYAGIYSRSWSLSGPSSFSGYGDEFDQSGLTTEGDYTVSFQFFVALYYSQSQVGQSSGFFTLPACDLESYDNECEYDDSPTGGGSVYVPVDPPEPTIYYISPSTLTVGQSTQITIYGANFGASPTVNLPSGVTLNSVQGSSPTAIAITVVGSTANSAAPVTVSAGGSTSNTSDITLQ